MNNVSSGKYGEKIASDYLIKKGYKVIFMNYRTPVGEIDIIAKDGEYTVFIEVKYRRHMEFGYPREAVGYKKQRRIIKSALFYINKSNSEDNYRFDVIEIIDMNEINISHIENAFY